MIRQIFRKIYIGKYFYENINCALWNECFFINIDFITIFVVNLVSLTEIFIYQYTFY